MEARSIGESDSHAEEEDEEEELEDAVSCSPAIGVETDGGAGAYGSAVDGTAARLLLLLLLCALLTAPSPAPLCTDVIADDDR